MEVAIFIVLLLCLGSLWLFWYKTTTKRVLDTAVPKEVKSEQEDNLAKLVEMIREEREEKARELRDKMLVENAKHRNRSGYPESIQVSQDTSRQPENLGGVDLLPYNLSEGEKEILRDFYRRG